MNFVRLLALAFFALACSPASAGCLLLLHIGKCSASGPPPIVTPSIVPQTASYFNTNSANGATNNALKPNNGVAGPFELPTITANSFVIGLEGTMDAALSQYANTDSALSKGGNLGINVTTNGNGQPSFGAQMSAGGAFPGSSWWNAISTLTTSVTFPTSVHGSNYFDGLYPFTTTGGGCARQPSGVWNGGGSVDTVDPGFLCGTAPTIDPTVIPLDGAQQVTGAGSVATTCVSNSPVTGEMTVTAHLAAAHGIAPGQTYTMQGFLNAGFQGYGTSTATTAITALTTGQVYTITALGTGSNWVAIGAGSATVGVTFTKNATAGTGTGTAYLGPGVVTYTALPGSTGSTLVGETVQGLTPGTCPTSPVTSGNEGTALNGSGGSITWDAISATNPYAGAYSTGVTTHNDQHFCAILGEYGADSSFPGGQFFSAVDEKGVSLPGSPALVPWLNQGVSNFTGYTVAGAQDTSFTFTASFATNVMTVTGTPGGTLAIGQTITGPNMPNGVTILSLGTGSGGAGTYNLSTTFSLPIVSATYTAHTYAPALTVTALKTYAITSASFNATTGYATFVMPNAAGFIPGSEFTVAGVTTSGGGSFNLTYVAVAGTTQTGTSVVGNPLSGPIGVPQVSALTNASTGTGGTMASLIMPDFQVLGTTNGTVISPYGTFGSTGTGGVGTYGLTSTMAGYSFTGSIAIPAGVPTLTTSGTAPAPVLVAGQSLTSSSGAGFSPTKIVSLLTGTGGSGSTYQVDVSQTAASGTIQAAGTLGSSGSPVTIFAYPQFYYSATPSVISSAPWGGTPTARLQATLGDVYNIIGANSTSATAGQNKTAWGGNLANVAMLGGAFPQATGGAPDTTQLAGLCKKTTDINTFAAANNMTVRTLYALNDPGIWGDSGAWMGTGYITNTTGTNATLVVSSTIHGAMTGPGTGTVVVSGPGIPGGPLAFPTTSLGVGPYTLTPNTTAATGSIGSPITMSAGTWNPATPVATGAFNGYIDAPGGVSTLHVTSLQSSNVSSFTGTLGNLITQGKIDIGSGSGTSGNTLTVTAISANPTIRYAQVGIGSLITGTGVAAGTRVDAIYPSINPDTGLALTGDGLTGTYHVAIGGVATPQLVATNQAMFVSDILPGAANEVQVTGKSGATLVAGMVATDGTAILTSQPLFMSSQNTTSGTAGETWSINQTYAPPFTLSAMTATNTTLVPGQYLVGPGITTPVSIIGYGTGTGQLGTYLLSNSANGTIGSSGSPIAMTGTGIGDAAGPAPGPALTINDLGGGVTFPATSISCAAYGSCTGTGTVTLTGTYDTSVLGGTPTTIQAQISLSSGGPPIAGCSACAWTNLTGYAATLSSGTVWNWTGQAVSIPASNGPLFVSVRASNGTAYADMTNFIKVGLAFEWQGEGQLGSLPSNQGGSVNSYFTGLWGMNNWISSNNDTYAQGPPVTSNYLPAHTEMYAGDRFSELQGGVPISESSNVYAQLLTNAFGWPVTVLNAARDGIGMTPETTGNVVQNQSIAVGDGTTTVFCSASKFCGASSSPVGVVSASGPLFYNAATQTGGSVTASISGNTLTTSAVTQTGGTSLAPAIMGALETGMTLSDACSLTNASPCGVITGSPTLVTCLTGCIPTGGPLSYPQVQTWTISGAAQTVASEAIRADLGSTPWPLYDLQSVSLSFVNGAFDTTLIKAGTFKLLVNGTTVCQDSSSFAYNVQSGNCTGTNIASSFVNYATGDYQVTFTSGHAPANNAVITASWTEIQSPDGNQTPTVNRPQGFDFFGDGTSTSGPMSSMFAKTPGGISGHVFGGGISDQNIMANNYAIGATGYTQSISWLYNVKFPNIIPGQTASTPFIVANYWRGEGANYFTNATATASKNMRFEQWSEDIATPSSWTGTIISSVMTLATASVGPMWEGEPIAINGVATGDYILDLKAGTWGASGSTYDIGNFVSVINTTGTSTLNNSTYYIGSAPTIYSGPNNDVVVQGPGACLASPTSCLNASTGYAPHPVNGFTGARRIAARWAALTWGGLTTTANASDPTLDRVKADATGCDAAALAAPCFDIGSTYQASHSATLVSASATITVTGGISAHARPFVVGQALSCAGCTTGRFITSIDVPPTQDTRAGQGEVGQTFHITASGTMGVSATETVNAGCSGTSGTGSNCIDVAISINTTNGTYGTAAALATCGENNLDGGVPPYITPSGVCQTNGIGSLVRPFRIGTNQNMSNVATGSVYDDGMDPVGGAFNQSAAYTCNIVAAKVVQCVKGAAYATTGLLSGIGQWSSGNTFIEYGDPTVGTSRINSLMGAVGGQPIPFVAGSGYTDSTTTPYTISAVCTSVASSGSVLPKINVTVSGGKIVNVYPANAAAAVGLGIGGGCTFATTSLGAGTGGSITPPVVTPLDGLSGIGTYNSDSNMMGDMLYDNSGLVGNPLNPFFTNSMGGYWEPGLPVHPWGDYLGAGVSG